MGSRWAVAALALLALPPYVFAYAAAKGAVRLMSKAAAVHCAQNGDRIRVNSVHPGGIVTLFVFLPGVPRQVAAASARSTLARKTSRESCGWSAMSDSRHEGSQLQELG